MEYLRYAAVELEGRPHLVPQHIRPLRRRGQGQGNKGRPNFTNFVNKQWQSQKPSLYSNHHIVVQLS